MNQKSVGSFLRVAVVVLIVVLGLGLSIAAQIISGDLVGTIFDKSGAVVPHATVEAVNSETGVKYTAEAGDTGEYRFNNLPVGMYKVSASAPNLATTTINNFKIDLNKTTTLPITLELKGAATSIEVSGVAAALDTTTSTVSTTFESDLNSTLPTAAVGGGVLNLSLLGAGVASSGGVGAGSGPSVGGQRPRNNNFTIEGVDNNSKSVTGPLVYVPNDAVQEFSILQNQYSPEFGHSSGGQFNQVVKGGTNSFNGLAYIYSQNRNFNAIDQATKNNGFTENQRYDNNRIGGQLGGPILKNKLFFFTNVEYNPVGQASVPGSPTCTPTAAGYATLDAQAAANEISATNYQIFKQYASPAPAATANCGTTSVNGQAVELGILPIAAPNFYNFWAVTSSLDYNISTKDQVRGRYIYNRNVGIDTAANLPVFFTSSPTKYHLVTINEYHTFSPTLTNEFRVGYNRFTNVTPSGSFSFPGLDSFPNLQFIDLGLQLGPDPNAPQFTIQNLYQASDSVTWTKGRHTLKVGIEGRKYISPQSFTQRARGDYDYNTLQQYLLDLTPDNLGERSLGVPVFYGDQSAVYWYVNDNWRIRPNLTINLGLRYEYTTIPAGEKVQSLNQEASVPGLVDFSEPRAPRNNWGPRIGLAYSPGHSGKTSIRAGAGISYDVLYDNIGILSLPPQLSGTIDVDLTSNAPNFLANGGILPATTAIQVFDPPNQYCIDNGIPGGAPCARFNTANHVVVDQKSPKAIDWTLGIQRTFWNDFTVEARYLGTRGIHLNTQKRLNAATQTNSTVFLPTYVTAPDQATLDASTYNLGGILGGAYGNGDGLVPAYENAGFYGAYMVQFTPNGNSTYHGLATQVTKRMSHGFQFIGSYTYSHTIDDSTADFFTTVLTPRRPQDFQNLSADRANSALDRRHRFTLALVYDMPYFKHSGWLARNTLSNWTIAPVYIYQSPEWMTVQSGVDTNLNGDSAGDRTVFNPAGVKNTGSNVAPLCTSAVAASDCTLANLFNVADDVVGYVATNPNAEYIRAYYGARPNVGRNTLASKPINDIDLTLAKTIAFTERYKVVFSMNAFNLLNHPQFVPGSLNQITSIGYTGGNVPNYVRPQSSLFNQADQTFASNARSLQLGLKIVF